MTPRDFDVRVLPRRRYRGKRARRQAFYHRLRMARLLTRLVNALPPLPHIEDACLDVRLYGIALYEHSSDGIRRVPPAEWRQP